MMIDDPCCTWCDLPIIPREQKYARVVGGNVFCSQHCAAGYLKRPTRDAYGFPYPTAAGSSQPEHGESWTHWAVFDNATIAEELAEHDDPDALGQALTNWAGSYGGPGRAFHNDPWAVRGRFHTLVRQTGGLDI